MRKRVAALLLSLFAILAGVTATGVQPAGAANVVQSQTGWFQGQNATYHVVVDWFDNGTGHLVAQKYALHTGAHLGQAIDAWFFDYNKVVIAPGSWGNYPLHLNICDDDNGAGSPNYYSPYPWGGLGDVDIAGSTFAQYDHVGNFWMFHGSHWEALGAYTQSDLYTNCATLVGV